MKNKFLYAIFHWSVHLLFILVPLYILNFNFSIISIALLTGILTDLDHLAIVPIKKWRMHLDADVPRKIPLHNFVVFSVTFFLSFSIIFNKIIGAFFIGIFLHLLWDLLEGFFIFHKGLKHWRI
jgi:hypothetical protein